MTLALSLHSSPAEAFVQFAKHFADRGIALEFEQPHPFFGSRED